MSQSVDLVRDLGPLALGSRLRRLTDRLMADAVRIYRGQHFTFQPRWFPLFYLLSYRSPLSVSEAAAALGVTPPAVSQTVKELQRRRLVSSTRDPRDERRRRLALTEKARQLLPSLLPLWNDFETGTRALLDDAGPDLLCAVEALEEALDRQPFVERILSCSPESAPSLQIVDYQPHHREAFERLNRAWLERDFHVDAADEAMLADPAGTLVDPGGALLLAQRDGEVVGCCGLLPRREGVFELIKMAVDERYLGVGIGAHLGRAAIRRARQLGGSRLVLETNSGLTPARALYRKLGFREVPGRSEVHALVDVWMELDLSHPPRDPAETNGIEIAPFRPDHQPQVIHLIVGIQAGEFSIPITAADHPDLDDIPRVYQKEGCFFVALDGDRVVGTTGLIRFAGQHVLSYLRVLPWIARLP